jgi:hypothetical protein
MYGIMMATEDVLMVWINDKFMDSYDIMFERYVEI